MTEHAANSDMDNDKEMTAEERVAWLRERGVQISSPEERRATSVQQGGTASVTIKRADPSAHSAGNDEESTSFNDIPFVKVPANILEPLEQLVFNCQSTTTSAVSPFTVSDQQLVNHLKPLFTSSKPVDLDLLPEGTRQLLASSTDDNNTQLNVSRESLDQVAAEGNVEVFALVHPTQGNRFVGINLYLDEVGMLKRLPMNKRASDYASLAGYSPTPQFYGDVYLSRFVRGGGHLPFILGVDTALDAPWLRAAAIENLEHQVAINQVTGRQDETQPSVAGTDQVAHDKVDGFSWTQTENELEITIPIPDEATLLTTRDVQVQFRPRSILVTVRKKEILVLPLFERIDLDSGTWTMEQQLKDGEETTKQTVITLSVEKAEAALWARIRD